MSPSYASPEPWATSRPPHHPTSCLPSPPLRNLQTGCRSTRWRPSSIRHAASRLAKAENRQDELLARRERRREELGRQRALSLQGVERITSVLVLPHPERASSEVTRLRQNLETEAIAMELVIEHERARGCKVEDVSARNVGYDVTSLDTRSGEMRLIEVKGLSAHDSAAGSRARTSSRCVSSTSPIPLRRFARRRLANPKRPAAGKVAGHCLANCRHCLLASR